jgi:hypothetical protein
MLKNVIATTVFAVSLGANAAQIDNGTYVTDDVAKIDFLKLSVTYNHSWNDVVVNDTLGYIAAGWEVADQRTLERANNVRFFDLMRPSSSDIYMNVATNNDAYGDGQEYLPESVLYDYMSGPCEYIPYVPDLCYEFSISLYDADYADATTAVALTRPSAIPLPAAAWLFGSALIGLGSMTRRKT